MAYDEFLFKKIFPLKSDRNSTDPEFIHYLQEIGTFHADRLALEPGRLAEEKAVLEEDTENLAYSNYKTFIQAANCSKEIFDDFIHINRNCDELLTVLPDLEAECQKFTSEAQKINSKRANYTLTLQKHTQLLEVLEILQVTDTCVRAGYYEEALELTQYVAKLERRLGHIPIIQVIANEIKNQRGLLLENLLDQLRTGLSLSSCLKVVAYLRRLNVFTEAELRIKFLLSRNNWFENMLAAIPNDNPYQHITKTMELSRVHLFDIITQYRAVFPDEDPMFMLSGRTGEGGIHLQSIFNSWVMEKFQQFFIALRADLHNGVEQRMDSVLAQCMHFGLSLGRVGADFRPLVVPLFENFVQQTFFDALDSATNQLLKSLIETNVLESFTHHSRSLKTTSASTTASSAVQNEPPSSLLQLPCLALYCNAILATFNNLRLCLPANLAVFFVDTLTKNFVKIAEEILAISKKPDRTSWTKAKMDLYKEICRLIVDDFVPFINNCLEVLFPEKQISDLLGMNSVEFRKLKSFGRVDKDVFVDILKEFLPTENVLGEKVAVQESQMIQSDI